MGEQETTGRMSVPPRLDEYAAMVTVQRLDRMLSHIEGVRQGDKLEPVHQMRVWSRRSRAALEIFRVCFPGKQFAEVEREVKKATDALSEARDLDVMIETMQKRADRLPEHQRAGVQSFVDQLKSQREDRQQAVAEAVTRLESHNLSQKFRDVASRQAQAEEERIIHHGHHSKKRSDRKAEPLAGRARRGNGRG